MATTTIVGFANEAARQNAVSSGRISASAASSLPVGASASGSSGSSSRKTTTTPKTTTTATTTPVSSTKTNTAGVYYDNYGIPFSTPEAAATSNAQNAYYNTNPDVAPPSSKNRNANQEAISTFASQNPNLVSTTTKALPESFTERLTLAQEAGIQNYTGTSSQNAQIQAYNAQQQQISNEAPKAPTGANTGQNEPSSGTYQPTQTNPVYIGPTLQQGSRGSDVQAVQSALGINADGVFGSQTLQAVKNFQASKGLTADGIVGPKTWTALSGTTTSDLSNISAGLSTPMAGQIDETTGEPITPLIQTGNPEIDALLNQLQNSSPQVQWSQVLKQVYKDMGYNEINDEYEGYNKEYAKLENTKNDDIQDINNNPWYTEGERVKRLQQLDKKYEGKELILQNKMKLAETQIDNLRSDAQYVTSQTMAQIQAQATLEQNVILKAIDIAEAQMAAESKLGEGFTLSPGEQRYDANGNLIASVSPKATSSSSNTPTSYDEWNLAGGQAGTGQTYAQYLTSSNVKAPTSAQQTVSTYAVRIEQANPIIDNLSGKIVAMNPMLFEAQKALPSYLQSDTYQSYDQASRNFINAVLRRESGAVISPTEFDNAYKQYLPRPSDSSDTLAQKKANRDIVYESLKNAAGGAYQTVDQLIGGSPQSSETYTVNGKVYVKSSDGLYYPQ